MSIAYPSTAGTVGSMEEEEFKGSNSFDYGILDFRTGNQVVDLSTDQPGVHFHHVPDILTGDPGKSVLLLSSWTAANGKGDPRFRQEITLIYCTQVTSPLDPTKVYDVCMQKLCEVMFSRHYSLKRVAEAVSDSLRIDHAVIGVLKLKNTLYHGQGRLVINDTSMKWISADPTQPHTDFGGWDMTFGKISFPKCDIRLYSNGTPGVSCRLIPGALKSDVKNLQSVTIISGTWEPQEGEGMMTNKSVNDCLQTNGWKRLQRFRVDSDIQSINGNDPRSYLRFEINTFTESSLPLDPLKVAKIHALVWAVMSPTDLEGCNPDEMSCKLASKMQKELNDERSLTSPQDMVVPADWFTMVTAEESGFCWVTPEGVDVSRGLDG
ncbi:hypothetical protein M231_07707 [Tremella mesenterica]|uniref:Uncharacterized protein n=2 Tax=Tremella mesenterica TaxID=5217 RepID=A0A4Q1B8G0_TREME|nr:hypothetical protein M231_07707 [Tremella mesenterica]